MYMLNETCPYCKHVGFSKAKPQKGNAFFIGSANTETKEIFADTGFIFDLYVCNHCGNIRLKMKQ